jgi:hypothetical protein
MKVRTRVGRPQHNRVQRLARRNVTNIASGAAQQRIIFLA